MSSGRANIPLPTVEALKAALAARSASENRNLEKGFLRRFSTRSIESEERYARLTGLRDHFRHKGWWSFFLMFLMFGMVVFQCVLLGMVGSGQWDFTEYDWLLPALLGQNLAQIVGLAVFVVRSLFSDPKIAVSASNVHLGDDPGELT